MEVITAAQNFLLDTFAPFIILLGLLIFVHELGHFLVAKMCKVRVEVFSLGFGKKIVTFVKGHTTYCISIIPLGGYVKMFGDDPSADIPEEDKKESFYHKPVGQRIAIVLAGPLMNFFFAIFLFAVVMVNGDRAIAPKVGDIAKNSFAATSGFHSGDEIVAINDLNPTTWKTLSEFIKSKEDIPLNFKILRNNSEVNLSVTPKSVENKNPLEWRETIGEIEGLVPSSKTSHVGVISSYSNPAANAGIVSLDQIIAINDKPIQLWRELEEEFLLNANKPSVNIKIKRSSTTEKTLILNLGNIQFSKKDYMAQIGLEIPDLYIASVVEGTPAEKAGLKNGDRILTINNKKITQWKEVISEVNSYDPETKTLIFEILRGNEKLTLNIQPKIQEVSGQHGQVSNRYQVGIATAMYQTLSNPITIKLTPLKALKHGWQQTILWSKMISLSFLRMIQNKISPKNIGGIFTIGQVASQTYKLGLSPYIKMMAVISINLFILNLLPIPVLDGGHLVFFTIEALRGSPVSVKKLEMAQQVGLLLLISLMAFSLFNDFSRMW